MDWKRVLVAAYFILVISQCKDASIPSPGENLPDQVVYGFVLHESASGKRLYTLNAAEAVVREPEGRIDVKSPIVTFYDEGGGVYSTLRAELGVILTRNEDLIARGNVVVQTAESTRLYTDSLVWNNTRKVVLTDAGVTIESPKGRIVGQGLIADAALNKIEIVSEVRGSSSYEFAP
ncbi:MAG: LPS export ABC transporter periplasmic protein LptC [candidate division WOR-3 bacterium]|nr:LPS export ABC transporter periplasmic protein LptC [candidate division WOR-3 bacterium]MDH7518254.1 LPS export ABC transporter periplasmic protein LptC [bacterium]